MSEPQYAPLRAILAEIERKCVMDKDPVEIYEWAIGKLTSLGAGQDNAALHWVESFDWYDELLAKRDARAALPESERVIIDWPWASWNNKIDPLEPGMLAAITAPDGQGKTILVEMMAEWWAKRKLKVVFVHYELNRALMMDRRTARHTSIEVRTLKSGTMTQEQRALVAAIRPKLLAWNGEITYLHTPGWTVDQTVAELRRQHAEGRCDVVVIDYLEKIAPSTRQMQIFGANVWQREGDNVEQFKNFAEITEVPVVMVAQMNKAGKDETYKRMSRNDMGGSAEKSNKANLVVLVKRDRDEDTGEYSNIMHVEIDKNTMGATGAFDQIMEPKFFRLTDIYREPLNK